MLRDSSDLKEMRSKGMLDRIPIAALERHTAENKFAREVEHANGDNNA